jgi:hypothetical protein
MSATSSKKRMPVWARSKSPGSTSPPLSRPKRTSSIWSGAIEAELTVAKGPLARSELLMDVARRHLLSRAGRAAEHDAAVGAGHLVELTLHRAEGRARARADHHMAGRVTLAQHRVLAPKPRRLERAADDHHQLVDVEGFLDEVVGTLLDGRDRDLDVAVAGDNHHRDRRVVTLRLLQDVDPVELAVLEPDVENDQVRRGVVDRAERGLAVPGEAHAVALVL